MAVVGFLLLIFLLRNLDYSYIKNFQFSLTFGNIVILLLIIFFIFIIRTIRWMLYLKSIGIQINFTDAYHIVVPSIALALITPAQTGDLLKVELLKKRKNIARRDSVATVLIEKLMDFLLIFVVFLISVGYFSLKVISFNYTTTIIAFLVGIIFLFIAFNFFSRRKSIFMRVLKNTKKIMRNFKIMFYTSILTGIYWVAICLSLLYVARIVNIDIAFFPLFGILSIGTIMGLLSLIPGALGVIEYSMVFLLNTFMSIPINQATIFALSFRIYSLIMYVIAYSHLLLRKS